MIELTGIKKEYSQFQLDVTMTVPKGRVIGLIGQNGAGKSTTFKAILDLISLDGGEVKLLGKNISEITSEDKKRYGVVLSDSGFSNYLTLADTLPILSNFYDSFDRIYFDNLVRKFNLPIDKKFKEFSTGMKAKLKMIVAVSHHPDLLILDEPTAGLDVLAREELLDVLRDFMIENEDHSILISSHISSDLETLCDEIYMIHEGQITLHETTDAILSEYAILKIDDDTFNKLQVDSTYLLRAQKNNYATHYLTNQKQFYLENYPSVIIEKIGIDEITTLMIKGEVL